MNHSIFTLAIRGAFLFLANILLLGSADFLFAADKQYPGLLNSPVPFYHDYNLASLYPVGKRASVSSKDGSRGSLTVEECISLALKDNPDHNISRALLRATTGDLLAAWGLYTPTLSATYGMSQSNTAIPFTDPAGNTTYRGMISKATQANINFSFTVFSQAGKYFGLKSAYYLRGSRRSELSSSELEVVNGVRAAYFNALRQEKLLIAAGDQADQLQKQLRRAEVRHSVGEVTRLDVLQAQIDLQNQELLILEYENQLVTAKMDLDLVVGGGLGIDFILADEFEIRETRFNVNELIAEALEKHPDLESLRLRIKQQQANLWMGRLAYLPIVRSSLGYFRSERDLALVPDYQRIRQVSFTMYWNILDAFARFQQNRYTQVAVDTLKYQFTKTRLTTARNIRESYLELLRLYERHLTLAESKKMAAQSLHLETRRYELGTSSMVELRQAQADYSQAEVDYINSIYDYHEVLSELSRNVGRDVSLDYRKY